MPSRKTPARSSPKEPIAALQLIEALAQSAFIVMNVLTRVAAEHELSLTQLRVFGILRDRTPRMAELAHYLGLDKSTLSGLVDRAEQRGILARTRSAGDARAFDVAMTAGGHTLAKRVIADVQRELAPLISHLATREQGELAKLLEQMLAPSTSITRP